jgi:tRNA threonylcarbamoyladenosine biosynthesis protein TsaE
MTRRVHGLDQMREFARELAMRAGRRRLILLDGPMGAGKTQFTRFFVEALGAMETTSPSFAIHNRYETPQGAVEHLDLFRLESIDDLESTGFWDFFLEPEGIVIIEWASRLREMHSTFAWPLTWPRWQIEISPVSGLSEARDIGMDSSGDGTL